MQWKSISEFQTRSQSLTTVNVIRLWTTGMELRRSRGIKGNGERSWSDVTKPHNILSLQQDAQCVFAWVYCLLAKCIENYYFRFDSLTSWNNEISFSLFFKKKELIVAISNLHLFHAIWLTSHRACVNYSRFWIHINYFELAFCKATSENLDSMKRRYIILIVWNYLISLKSRLESEPTFCARIFKLLSI